MSDFLEDIYIECAHLRGYSSRLYELGEACERLGMDRLADELFTLHRDVYRAQEAVSNAVGGNVQGDLVEAQQGAAHTLKTLLDEFLEGK